MLTEKRKTKKKKKPALPSKKSLRNKADRLWQDIAKLKGPCQVCGSNDRVIGHHVVTKHDSSFLRFNLSNRVNLCNNCHFKLHIKDDISITHAILRILGEDAYNALQDAKKTPVKLTREYYLDWIEYLEGVYNERKSS